MWNDVQLSYLAGIMDGEGTFNIGLTKNKFNSRMYVVNTDERLIHWLKNTFGGLTYTRNSLKNPHWKTKYEWIIEKAQIDPICKLIIPFLIIKKEQAELMVKFRTTFIKGKRPDLTEEIRSFRTKCFENMKKLNHRSSIPF
jgi:LAGLIDADG endonuclease